MVTRFIFYLVFILSKIYINEPAICLKHIYMHGFNKNLLPRGSGFHNNSFPYSKRTEMDKEVIKYRHNISDTDNFSPVTTLGEASSRICSLSKCILMFVCLYVSRGLPPSSMTYIYRHSSLAGRDGENQKMNLFHFSTNI